jgi:hypothetical protein
LFVKDALNNPTRDKKGNKQLKKLGNEQLEASNFELKQFDYEQFKLDSLILVLGKRRFGKSTWARYVLSKLWHCFPDGGYVFTRTKHNY